MGFDQGFALGVQQSENRIARQRQDAIRAEEAPDREMERRLRAKRLEQLSSQMLVEDEARRRDAADLVRSDTAFNEFQKNAEALDWSRPDALKTYQSLQKQFVPSITRHKSGMAKFQAYNAAVMGSQDYTAKMATATQMADLRKQLIDEGLGAESFAIGKSVERGEKSVEDAVSEFADLLKHTREQKEQRKFEQQVQLRRAPTEARIDGELMGAYGGTSRGERGERVDDLTKMEAKSLIDRIDKADEALRTIPPSETSKREEALRNLNSAKAQYRKLKESLKSGGSASAPVHDNSNGQPAARSANVTTPAGGDDKVVVEKDGKRFRLPRHQLEQAQNEGYSLVQ